MLDSPQSEAVRTILERMTCSDFDFQQALSELSFEDLRILADELKKRFDQGLGIKEL